MTVYIDGKTGHHLADRDITDPLGHGVQVIRSTDTFLADLVVHDCKRSGIRDFATRTTIHGCTVRANGRDPEEYNGDGILLQGQGHVVEDCTVTDNGSHTTFEHGIYASSVARDYRISGCILRGNAASGIKASGGGWVEGNDISGSVRGLVLADTVPAQVVIRRNRIAGTTYAVILTSNADLTRFDSDENTYPAGSRFLDARTGKNYDLAGWQAATGLDRHSVYATAPTRKRRLTGAHA
jgi:hypothetical protein